MRLEMKISGGAELAAKLRAMPARILTVLKGGVTGALFKLQSKIVREKLSGQVLKPQTGTLARSVSVTPAEIEGQQVHGVLTAASPPAMYGVYHERGGVGPYEIMAVRARALRWVTNGEVFFAHKVLHPRIRQRSFFFNSASESLEQIKAELQNAVNQALKEN